MSIQECQCSFVEIYLNAISLFYRYYFGIYSFEWYSTYRPQKDERLSQPWSHPVVLNTGPLDWKSSTLTTRPLLHHFTIPKKLLSVVLKPLLRSGNCCKVNIVQYVKLWTVCQNLILPR